MTSRLWVVGTLALQVTVHTVLAHRTHCHTHRHRQRWTLTVIKFLKLYLKTSVSNTVNAHWLLNELPQATFTAFMGHRSQVTMTNKKHFSLKCIIFVHFIVLRWVQRDPDSQKVATLMQPRIAQWRNSCLHLHRYDAVDKGKHNFSEYFKARQMLQCKIVIKRVSF